MTHLWRGLFVGMKGTEKYLTFFLGGWHVSCTIDFGPPCPDGERMMYLQTYPRPKAFAKADGPAMHA